MLDLQSLRKGNLRILFIFSLDHFLFLLALVPKVLPYLQMECKYFFELLACLKERVFQELQSISEDLVYAFLSFFVSLSLICSRMVKILKEDYSSITYSLCFPTDALNPGREGYLAVTVTRLESGL